MTLGDIIKNYREEHKISMDTFSEKSGISKAYISLLEKNKHPKTGKPIAPSIQCIKQAADAMNMDFNVLFSKIDSDVSLNNTNTSSSAKFTPQDPDIRRIERARQNMTQKDRDKMMTLLETAFEDYFGDDYIDEDYD